MHHANQAAAALVNGGIAGKGLDGLSIYFVFLGRNHAAQHIGASMRPRHNGRGKRSRSRLRPRTAPGFNEAPAQWPGKGAAIEAHS